MDSLIWLLRWVPKSVIHRSNLWLVPYIATETRDQVNEAEDSRCLWSGDGSSIRSSQRTVFRTSSHSRQSIPHREWHSGTQQSSSLSSSVRTSRVPSDPKTSSDGQLQEHKRDISFGRLKTWIKLGLDLSKSMQTIGTDPSAEDLVSKPMTCPEIWSEFQCRENCSKVFQLLTIAWIL